jgi:hypothetical protein
MAEIKIETENRFGLSWLVSLHYFIFSGIS